MTDLQNKRKQHIEKSSQYCQAQKGTMVRHVECSICGNRGNLLESAARDLFPPQARHIAPLVIHCDDKQCVELANDHLLWHRLEQSAYTLGSSHPLMNDLKQNVRVKRASGAIDTDWFIESSRLLLLPTGELVITMESKGSKVGKSVPLISLVDNNKELFRSICSKNDLDKHWALPALPDLVKVSSDIKAIETHGKITSLFNSFVESVKKL